jgi:hypothetical protein
LDPETKGMPNYVYNKYIGFASSSRDYDNARLNITEKEFGYLNFRDNKFEEKQQFLEPSFLPYPNDDIMIGTFTCNDPFNPLCQWRAIYGVKPME